MGKNSGKKAKCSSEGISKTLLTQFNTVLDTARRDFPGSKGTVYRCKSSMRQFLSFCASNYRMQNIRNIHDKHIQAFINYRRKQGITEKSIKNDIWQLGYFTGIFRKLKIKSQTISFLS